MHDADRVVVLLTGRDFEHRVSGLDLRQAKTHQLCNRRRGQPPVADRAQEIDAGHRAAGVGERGGIAPLHRESARHQ